MQKYLPSCVKHGKDVENNYNNRDSMKNVATLALGSRLRQGLAKVRANSEARESHFILLGV